MTMHDTSPAAAPAGRRASGGSPAAPRLRRYQAARWDEPTVLALGYPGRRGVLIPPVEPAIAMKAGDASALVPERGRPRSPSSASGKCCGTTSGCRSRRSE
jgi:hypothetical protein